MNFINKVEKEYHESGQMHRRVQTSRTASLTAAGSQLAAALGATPSPSAVVKTAAPKVELGVAGHCGSIATVTVKSMTEYKV